MLNSSTSHLSNTAPIYNGHSIQHSFLEGISYAIANIFCNDRRSQLCVRVCTFLTEQHFKLLFGKMLNVMKNAFYHDPQRGCKQEIVLGFLIRTIVYHSHWIGPKWPLCYEFKSQEKSLIGGAGGLSLIATHTLATTWSLTNMWNHQCKHIREIRKTSLCNKWKGFGCLFYQTLTGGCVFSSS